MNTNAVPPRLLQMDCRYCRALFQFYLTTSPICPVCISTQFISGDDIRAGIYNPPEAA